MEFLYASHWEQLASKRRQVHHVGMYQSPTPISNPLRTLTEPQMAQHWIFLTVLGFTLGGLLFLCFWWIYGRFLISGGPKGQSFRRRLPFWRRSKDKIDYELLERGTDDRREE